MICCSPCQKVFPPFKLLPATGPDQTTSGVTTPRTTLLLAVTPSLPYTHLLLITCRSLQYLISPSLNLQLQNPWTSGRLIGPQSMPLSPNGLKPNPQKPT